MRARKVHFLWIALLVLCTSRTAKQPLKLGRLSSLRISAASNPGQTQGHAAASDAGEDRLVRVLLIRHGEAFNNIVEHSYMVKKNSTSFDLEGTYRYKRRNNELIFSGLTDRGDQQAIEAGKFLREAYPNVKYVFISPMLRTVETALLIMRGSPREVQYFLLPWLKERIGLQADIGYNSYEAINSFPIIDAHIIKDKPFWFLDYWDEQHDEEGLGQQMRALVAETPSIDALLDFLVLKKKRFAETLQQVAYRKDKALQHVRDFIRKQETAGVAVRDDEILLVSHYSILMAIIVGGESKGKVLTERDMKTIPNCKIIPFDLDL